MKKLLYLLLLLTAYASSAQTFLTLHQFNAADGQAPNALIQGSDGKIYGTTGPNTSGADIGGTIFSMNSDGSSFAVLHWFTNFVSNGSANTNSDGISPANGALIQGNDGELYGVASVGGLNANGTIFRMDTDGNHFTVLHTFGWTLNAYNGNTDGAVPSAMIQGNDGNLYGATYRGGLNNLGVIFKLNTNGDNFSVLYHFGSSTPDDGAGNKTIIQGRNGIIYGVAQAGRGEASAGVIFGLDAGGVNYSILRSFNRDAAISGMPGADAGPIGIIQGADSQLYGITFSGEIFAFDTSETNVSILYAFTNETTQGNTIIQASDGKLYGKTQGGGLGEAAGSHIFSLNTDGTAFNYVYIPNGNSTANLIQGKDGALYGTTTTDPDSYYGTIYKLPANILQIVKNGSNGIAVSWPSWANGYYTLQTNSTVSANGWTEVFNGIVTVINNFVLTNTPTGNSGFFRLH